MLPQKRRVKKQFIPKILKNGQSLSGANFTIKFLDRKDDKASLFSFVVSTKVAKTSVDRHRIKRKMSAATEATLPSIRSGVSVLVFAKKDIKDKTHLEIIKEISSLLSKI